jgi:hypothetical protein
MENIIADFGDERLFGHTFRVLRKYRVLRKCKKQ